MNEMKPGKNKKGKVILRKFLGGEASVARNHLPRVRKNTGSRGH